MTLTDSILFVRESRYTVTTAVTHGAPTIVSRRLRKGEQTEHRTKESWEAACTAVERAHGVYQTSLFSLICVRCGA